jgi:heat shock protein HslJ
LRLEDEAAAVTSDCNTCNGSYAISDSSLEMGPLACTRIFCGSESLDPLFPQALAGGHRVLLSGSELALQSFAQTLRFRN